ncbi:cytochrome P450 CYP82D47-like isoform X2 [Telopea speciosissima]|uniref:cytochrome P450 CYP82D47-like isoform X2 n=1 Tax=Telopea speciosissima TaxID=54955 RepID=UPI001CC4828E|nr:cytochrome P450 CYP82D47-like isoform X2 [Telopea speciosissima]
MEIAAIQIQAVAVFVALILIYRQWRVKSNTHKSKWRLAPEPSGAFPILGHLLLLGGQETVTRTLGAIADKYGPAFMLRLGANLTLVVSSWEMMKDCFTINDRVLATRPLTAVGKHIGYDYANIGFAPYGPYWREIRKIATIELLSKTRLEMLKHVRINEIDVSIKELYSLWVKHANKGTQFVKIEMKQWFEHLSFNVITKMIAGKRYFGNVDAGYEDEARRFRKAIDEIAHLSGEFVISDALPYLKWLDLGGYLRSMKCVAKEVDSIIGNWVEEHRSNALSSVKRKGEELDFIDVMLSIIHINDNDLLKSSYDGDTIIKATVLALITASSDTTSVTLTWALSLLLNNRQVLKKAQDELDNHVSRERHVDESDIKNLVYLHAIVKETLRLYPAAPLAIPHQATEDCKVGGYDVPKGTQLLVNIWKLQRDPRVWLDPHEFKPERFLTTHANVDVRGQQFEFIPFGSGVRSCPGITFAMQVLHLTLARLLHGFNLETPSCEPIDMSEGLGLTLPKKTPLEVLLSPRLPSKLYE